MSTISNPLPHRKHQPELISGTFLTGNQLPVANVLPETMIVDAFKKRNALFGENTIAIYGTILTLLAFLMQVLSDGKQRSCSAAVSRIVAYAMENGINPPTGNTGNYCSARAKLDPDAIRDLMQSIHRAIDKNTPEDLLWRNRRVLLVDGFTNTLDATDENLAMFPASGS